MAQCYINIIRRMITDVGNEPDAFTTDDYTIPAQAEEYQLDVAEDVTITLPACSLTHPLIKIRNLINDPSDDTVTVEAAGSDTIDGQASRTFEGEYNIAYFLPNTATNWSWSLSPTLEDKAYNAELFFKDSTIQDELERNSNIVTQHWLEDVSPDDPPDTPYTDFFAYRADAPNWCTVTTKIYDEDHTELTPNTSDNEGGIWYFNTEQTKDIYARGKIFDIYATAATLLTRWANSLKLDYSYSSVAGNFSRLERIEQLLALADQYWQKSSKVNIRSKNSRARYYDDSFVGWW